MWQLLGATDLFLNICTICSYLQVIQNTPAGRAMIVRLDISSASSDQSSDFGRWSRPALFKEFLTSSAVSCRGFLMSCHFLSMQLDCRHLTHTLACTVPLSILFVSLYFFLLTPQILRQLSA